VALTAVSLRLYAELAELVGAARHLVPVTGARSVKDVVESVGVPHVEVALLLCDGEPVGFDHLVVGGERVAALPSLRHLGHDGVTTVVAPAPDEPRFLCDVHLGTLARRLRVLGLDTRYEPDLDDADLAQLAATEGLILLSRDRGLLMRRVVTYGYLPRSEVPDDQALEVIDRFDLGSHLAPFSRCVPCNGTLMPVERDEVWDELPPRTRASIDTYARCDRCGRLFWPGSHVDGLARFLDRVSALTGRTLV
jgi:uncharacterized protein